MVRISKLAIILILAVGPKLAVVRVRALGPVAPQLVRAPGRAHEEPVDLELGGRQVGGPVAEVARLRAPFRALEVARVAELEPAVLVLDARVVPVEQLRLRRPHRLVQPLVVPVDQVVLLAAARQPLGRRDVDGLAERQAGLAYCCPA